MDGLRGMQLQARNKMMQRKNNRTSSKRPIPDTMH